MTSITSRFGSLARWLDRVQPPEVYLYGGAALVVGLASGVAIWLFKELIEWFRMLFFGDVSGQLAALGNWTIALVPVLGGLIVGALKRLFIGEERHHGVSGIMEAVALGGGRLRYRRMPAKAIASAVSLGSGASVGPEDPSVQIGSNLGSMVGQWLRLSDDRMRTLVAAGAAAGVASAFNAPIAGVFFALEIIIGELSSRAFGIVVMAAVIASVFTQAVAGAQPAFHVPAYAFNSALELPLYVGLGLLAGPIAALYVGLVYRAQDRFHAMRAPGWLRPAIAGLLVGVVGIFFHQVFGEGYETVEGILGGEAFPLMLLVTLLAAKLVLTPVSIGGGFLGGVFAPSLFLGATLGAAYGQIANLLFPAISINPAAYAMVGMAAVLAGAVHAPLTAILLLFEMTRDYRIILPLMFAVAISLILSQRLRRDSVYTLGLARRGIRLAQGRDIEVLEGLRVDEVMQTAMPALRESDTLATASDLLLRTRHHGLPVVDVNGDLAGILTVQDLEQAQAENREVEHTVGEMCTRDLLVTYPDETIGAALRRMSVRDVGRLPVVARDNPRRLVGLLRRTDLVRAYDVALTRRAAMRHRAHQVRLGAFSGANVEEIVVQPGAPCVGRMLKDVGWPRDCVIASVRRGRRMMIPRGNTLLQAGDVLVAVVEGDARDGLRRMCVAEVAT